ncbi:protein BREAST CANCER SUSCEPTIBILITY 1 homolog isoform X1 [Musa acuminata AAA Group]|uniref:protein BREAST CANCER SUSCEPTIBILITY 1 homolog isoform X1 n=2 Tax=Musa acuminata AAA Group TaxID=214697 RepID=UPI0031D65F13
MADLANLEKMGTELKCPICWSLLNSAVSLSCNHVFCNSCIAESMKKSASDCPVCKVPFRRREVRAAPHMDNLVSIFKSMEDMAGTNIFSTQIGPQNSGNQEEHIISTDTMGECQKKSKRKECSQIENAKEKTKAGRSPHYKPKTPSFPAKKRIHVTPYSASETPLRPEKIHKLEDARIELTGDTELNDNKKLFADDTEDPSLSPFFWLRGNDDIDESPQKPSDQQIMETPSPQSAPCFSDMKDSDDEKPTLPTPTNKLNVAADFDSEMFEWSQRAYSPELFSTPQRTQTVERHRLLKIPEKECQGNIDAVVHYEDANVGTASIGKKILHKRRRNSNTLLKSRKSLIKEDQDFRSHDVNGEVPCNSEDLVDRSYPKPKRTSVKGCQKSATRYQTSCSMSLRSLKKQFNNAAIEASEQSPDISVKAKYSSVIKGSGGTAKRSDRKIKGTDSELQRKHLKRSNIDVQAEVPEAIVSLIDDAEIQDASNIKLPELPASTLQQRKPEKLSSEILDKSGKHIHQKKRIAKNQASELKVTSAVKVPATPMGTAACESNKTSSNALKEYKLSLDVKNTSKNRIQSTENIIMRKCQESHSPIRCAFCHSSTYTEDSGEMMHYFNGKPVAADFNGGRNVIHSHKHCTEWAPDVYFEDDMAINLTAEVSRSRRIKCSCCGTNGAALGCYERSCRKSFHFTCAKLMQECKWDTQNFVMLCPLHSSMELPNEVSEPQRQSRKKSTPKGSSQASSINTCDHPSQKWKWPSGSPCKWMICCSALSAAEKEAVSKFAKVTGVPISNTWNPEITHIIASTDHNGAYRRTLKILKGIIDGKWILKVDSGINACMDAMEPIDEEKFEVTVDIHGISDGPRLGRLRAINKQPKFFNGFKFYFSGDYTPSYKGYLQDLVIAAGGSVLQRKPISRDNKRLLGDASTWRTLIVFSIEHPEKHNCNSDTVIYHRRSEGQALADASGGTLAGSTWIIDSIAACKLQPLT